MSLRAKINALPVPRIARFTAVLAIAMAAGHLAQTMAAHKPARLAPVAQIDAVPTHIVQVSSGGITAELVVRMNPEQHLLALEKPSLVDACAVTLTLKSLPRAMIAVALAAPCRNEERVVLHQAGLAVTGVISGGKLVLTLPALTVAGDVTVQFADGRRVKQTLLMPEAAAVQRFAVQWQGPDAFQLHGMEGRADFDQPGDISRRNPVGAGFMTMLGNAAVENPLLAQVYTFPTDVSVPLQIVLEAAVLPETCGHDLLGQVLTSQSGQVKSTDLTLSMPDCSAVGDFLVLKNLASDVKVAAN